MTKSSLKIAEPPTSFPDVLQQILALRAEQHDASRIERRRLNATAYLAEAIRLSASTLPEIEALDAHLSSLPPSPEHDPALRFVNGLTRLAADRHGTHVPPAGNFPYGNLGSTAEEVAGSCLDLHVSKLELAAVAALRATRSHPEIFKEGCDDAAKHEEYLTALATQIEELMTQAAKLLTLDDLLFSFANTGIAHVSYALSKGMVPASGPGDPRGIPGLIAWLEAQA
jgi:hypothetical protein